jgi:hypothetical protein
MHTPVRNPHLVVAMTTALTLLWLLLETAPRLAF